MDALLETIQHGCAPLLAELAPVLLPMADGAAQHAAAGQVNTAYAWAR